MDKIKVWVKKRKLKKGYSYYVEWQDPRTGKFRTESAGTDKAYAKQKAAERRNELLTGLYSEVVPISYDDYKAEHLLSVKSRLSNASYIEHERALRYLGKICQPKNLTVIDYSMLEKYQSSRIAAGLAPASLNKEMRTLQAAFECAKKRSYIKRNPFAGNRKTLYVREAEPTPVIVEPEELGAILKACPDEAWRGVVLTGYFAGLRLSEIINLKWADVDLVENMLHVVNYEDHKTKSGKIRHIPMNQELAKALTRLQSSRFRSDYVFTTNTGGKLRPGIANQFTRIVTEVGLVDEHGKHRITLHNLRDTFITNLLESGTDPRSVMELAGHRSIKTTMRYYAGVRAKNLTDAVNRLSRYAASGA